MNADFVVHSKLQHIGLITADLEPMVDWYWVVLGMTVTHRSPLQKNDRHGPPFSACAFLSNAEMHHRIVLFEAPAMVADPEWRRQTGMQHVSFAYQDLDDLLGNYVRLESLGVLPIGAADHGVGVSFYYEDPDQNRIELNVSNFMDEWTATECMRAGGGGAVAIDPRKLVEARNAGQSAWRIHQRAVARELGPHMPQSRVAVL